jgi:hypothetical protein
MIQPTFGDDRIINPDLTLATTFIAAIVQHSRPLGLARTVAVAAGDVRYHLS